jgi:DDE superfamily endonuclease
MDKKVRYVSKCWVGQIHDFSMLKEEFPPTKPWFENHEIKIDLGFLGFDKDYVCKLVRLPHKKSKGKELSDEQKKENKENSRERIKVEHSIGGMKRFKILSDRARIHDVNLYDDILGVCAGLWNFYLSY